MNPLRAILFKLLSVALFVIMASLIKAASDQVPAGQAVFFRSLFAVPVIVLWLAARGDLRTGLRSANPMGHFWRGFVGTSAMGLMFAGLALLPLPEVTAIGYATPLLVVIFAAMFLGEEVRLFRLGLVMVGLIGVLIMLSPRLTALTNHEMDARLALGAVITLAGAGCAALAQVFIRKLVQTEQTSAIVFWFSISATLLSLLTLPFGWVMPTWDVAVMLVLAGFIGGVAQIFLTSSYRFANASVVAPFDYASMLFAVAIGYVFFDELPTRPMVGGAALVIGAGVVIIWRERQLGLERDKQRKAQTPLG
ncbi:DMT family transporter [Actibacterium sp. XHP0104]|uniref:DMT family transporter n=1 Tax=Actibacterium sp. XHP0104 TaxID=2984335 RepID=UPI0021E7FED3|nr:DMT family transporter [Actibacterium sp. XHP0104]MCV2882023.1 DMT family transporter [Actibacterium sp. XHP0104]